MSLQIVIYSLIIKYVTTATISFNVRIQTFNYTFVVKHEMFNNSDEKTNKYVKKI